MGFDTIEINLVKYLNNTFYECVGFFKIAIRIRNAMPSLFIYLYICISNICATKHCSFNNSCQALNQT